MDCRQVGHGIFSSNKHMAQVWQSTWPQGCNARVVVLVHESQQMTHSVGGAEGCTLSALPVPPPISSKDSLQAIWITWSWPEMRHLTDFPRVFTKAYGYLGSQLSLTVSLLLLLLLLLVVVVVVLLVQVQRYPLRRHHQAACKLFLDVT